MPDQGLWGVEQEHDRLVVNVDGGDRIEVQSDLGSNRKRNLNTGSPLNSLSAAFRMPFHSSPLRKAVS